jgi:hypothetical protein
MITDRNQDSGLRNQGWAREVQESESDLDQESG